tara:strand:+ start:1179 stop:2945 length:1767 start_codon:yes stop_codon:yes gene_type:complete
MIEFITYYFLLLLYTQFSVFKKFRENINFSFLFLITTISAVVFIYTCYKILTDENYFFNITIPEKNTRKILLLFFIGSFFSILFFFITKYIRELSNQKTPPQGMTGIMGKRGEEGNKSDKCDTIKCKRVVCNKRILNHISKTFSDIIRSKGGKKISQNREISNNFIKNKVKLLCRSPQLQKFISKQKKQKQSDSAYDYITRIWGEWTHIIMKYEQGEHFMETDYLNDNDFDNLIRKADRVYSSFREHNSEGTPSEGKESPFDEIKKYDMWYWGEPVNTKIKIKYKCDYSNKGQLKMLMSNDLSNIWRSKTARQAKVNLCRNNITEENTYVPYLPKGSEIISIYRPNTIDTKEGLFKPMGDIILSNDITDHKKEKLDDIIPKDKIKINYTFNRDGDPKETTILVTGDVKSPIDFKLKYKSFRNDGIGKGISGYSIWQPIAPDGYICPGNVLDKTSTMTPPNKEKFNCVPETCVRKIKKKKIWNNKDEKTTVSDCNNDKEYDGSAIVDTDELETYRERIGFFKKNGDDKYNLFKTLDMDEDDTMYELIPSGEMNSCFDKESSSVIDNSKWIVNDKNNDKYSIHSFFENNK